MRRLAILDDYQGVATRYADWTSLGTDVEVTVVREHLEPDALIEALEGVEIVIAMRERTRFPADVLERLPALRFIATTGGQNAAIDLKATAARGIVVSGTTGSSIATSELAWSLILALVRHVATEDAALRAGRWQETVGIDLAGLTLGLAGLGRLGAAMVPVARAFAMETIAWSENLDPDRARSLGVEPVDKDALLERADVLSIHLVLSRRTRGLFGAAELARMKPTAYLVNTSRGPIVDEAALVAALNAHTIAGAGLDVYDLEPLPKDHPLLGLANTVLTPHLGYVTDRTYVVWYRELLEDVAAYLAGAPVRVIAL